MKKHLGDCCFCLNRIVDDDRWLGCIKNNLSQVMLGGCYIIQKPMRDGEHICVSCFKFGIKKGWIHKYKAIQCSACETKYTSSVGPDNLYQGWNCCVTFRKDAKVGSVDYAGYGSSYDCNCFTLLVDANTIAHKEINGRYNFCDTCLTKFVKEGKMKMIEY